VEDVKPEVEDGESLDIEEIEGWSEINMAECGSHEVSREI
jgi:hypothetical protein